MISLLNTARQLAPGPIKNLVKSALVLKRNLTTSVRVLMFPFNKKVLVSLIKAFPEKAWLYEALLNEFHRNRKNYRDAIAEHKEFLFFFHQYFRLQPESIIKWRVSVYFAYLIQQDFDGMLKMMSEYLKNQKDIITKLQLNDFKFSISSQNVFSSYNVHAYLDTHVKARILGMQEDLKIVLLLKTSDTIANPVMLEYWKKYITVVTCEKTIAMLEPFAHYLEQDLSFCAPINGTPVYIEHAKSIVQKKWEKAGNKPLFELSDEDIDFGWSQLEKFGIPRNSWFVSLHVRDPGYKLGSHLAEDEFDSYRNANIDNYKMAIQSIISRGGHVVRVGDPKMKDIPSMEGLFDYIHSDIRSNRMDIFLFSQCRFFVGVSSGPILNPILFGVPTIMTNFMPVTGRPHAGNCLYIPKLLWFNDEKRFASFNEILSTDLGRIFTTHGYTQRNISIIENSQEELNDIVVEMLDVLDKSLTYSAEDDLLQEQLNKLYREYSGYRDMSRIGKKFIEKYSLMGLI